MREIGVKDLKPTSWIKVCQMSSHHAAAADCCFAGAVQFGRVSAWDSRVDHGRIVGVVNVCQASWRPHE